VCGYHHRRAHDPRYTVEYLPTGEIRYRYRRHWRRTTTTSA
jgi:hypothetical protein